MNKKYILDYSLFIEDGDMIETSVGAAPLVFYSDDKDNQILPALRKIIEVMEIGEKKRVVLKPSEAYGEILESGFKPIPKDQIPEKYHTIGSMVPLEDEAGNTLEIPVHDIKDNNLILNCNHPLAGQTLVFKLHLKDVIAA